MHSCLIETNVGSLLTFVVVVGVVIVIVIGLIVCLRFCLFAAFSSCKWRNKSLNSTDETVHIYVQL